MYGFRSALALPPAPKRTKVSDFTRLSDVPYSDDFSCFGVIIDILTPRPTYNSNQVTLRLTVADESLPGGRRFQLFVFKEKAEICLPKPSEAKVGSVVRFRGARLDNKGSGDGIAQLPGRTDMIIWDASDSVRHKFSTQRVVKGIQEDLGITKADHQRVAELLAWFEGTKTDGEQKSACEPLSGASASPLRVLSDVFAEASSDGQVRGAFSLICRVKSCHHSDGRSQMFIWDGSVSAGGHSAMTMTVWPEMRDAFPTGYERSWLRIDHVNCHTFQHIQELKVASKVFFKVTMLADNDASVQEHLSALRMVDAGIDDWVASQAFPPVVPVTPFSPMSETHSRPPPPPPQQRTSSLPIILSTPTVTVPPPPPRGGVTNDITPIVKKMTLSHISRLNKSDAPVSITCSLWAFTPDDYRKCVVMDCFKCSRRDDLSTTTTGRLCPSCNRPRKTEFRIIALVRDETTTSGIPVRLCGSRAAKFLELDPHDCLTDEEPLKARIAQFKGKKKLKIYLEAGDNEIFYLSGETPPLSMQPS